MPRYRDEAQVAKLIVTAVKKITEYDKPSMFVKAERARSKARKLEPTDNQAKLLRYIHTHGVISFEETLGMDWRFLGGLFTRGLVEWGTRDGVYGVVEAL